MKGTVESSILFAVLTEAMDFRAGRCISLAVSKEVFDIFLHLSYLRLFVHGHTLLVSTIFGVVLKTFVRHFIRLCLTK